MKILVYGAGVIGSLYAVRLQEVGYPVTILARGERLEEIRTQGVVLENAETGERTTTSMMVTEQLAPQDAYDLVIVAVRKNQLSRVLNVLAAHQNTPNILFLVNNAEGPGEIVRKLGRERVMLGFPAAAGRRIGPVVRYVQVKSSIQVTTLGELDGGMTMRLEQAALALETAGFQVAICDDMDAWLKTHAASILPLAAAIYMAGGDNYRMARTQDALVLIVRGMREGYRALRGLGIPIVPGYFRAVDWIPEPLLVAYLKRRMGTERVELVVASHANAARDEMQELAREFALLVDASGVETPALDRLFRHFELDVAPLREGAAFISLDWRTIWALALSVAAVLGLATWATRRRGKKG
jgi:2-dehydropantoate 2-reductase